jgi:hypothetical protein
MSDEHGNVSLPVSMPDASPWWLRGVAASIIFLLVASVWFLARQGPRVPVYRGKSLPVWLRTYAVSSSSRLHSREWNEADDAVRHMGTNCIPVLLHMIREKDSKLKLLVMSLARKQRVVRLHFVAAAERNVEASSGLAPKKRTQKLCNSLVSSFGFRSQWATDSRGNYGGVGGCKRPQ